MMKFGGKIFTGVVTGLVTIFSQRKAEIVIEKSEETFEKVGKALGILKPDDKTSLKITGQCSHFFGFGTESNTEVDLVLTLKMQQMWAMAKLASRENSTKIALLYPIHKYHSLVGLAATIPAANPANPKISFLAEYNKEKTKAQAELLYDTDSSTPTWGKFQPSFHMTVENIYLKASKGKDYINFLGGYTIAPPYTVECGIGHKFLAYGTESDASLGIRMKDVKGFEIAANITGTLEVAAAAAEGTYALKGAVSKIRAELAKELNGVNYKLAGEVNPAKSEAKIGFVCSI